MQLHDLQIVDMLVDETHTAVYIAVYRYPDVLLFYNSTTGNYSNTKLSTITKSSKFKNLLKRMATHPAASISKSTRSHVPRYGRTSTLFTFNDEITKPRGFVTARGPSL